MFKQSIGRFSNVSIIEQSICIFSNIMYMLLQQMMISQVNSRCNLISRQLKQQLINFQGTTKSARVDLVMFTEYILTLCQSIIACLSLKKLTTKKMFCDY